MGLVRQQQLVKNLLFEEGDNPLSRKLLEIPIALRFEMALSKKEILTGYLNQLHLPTMAASCAAVAREAAASNLDYLAFLTMLCGQEVAQRA